VNNEKMLPNRCHGGYHVSGSPVISRLSGFVKSFPLEYRTLTPHHKMHFQFAFRPRNPRILGFPERLSLFCSHFVATAIHLKTTVNDYPMNDYRRKNYEIFV
jgi:hypothetical protein